MAGTTCTSPAGLFRTGALQFARCCGACGMPVRSCRAATRTPKQVPLAFPLDHASGVRPYYVLPFDAPASALLLVAHTRSRLGASLRCARRSAQN